MASSIRGIFGISSLILIAGSIVLIFFVVLSGLSTATPLDKVWFLQADTSNTGASRAVSQWTYFYVCGEGNSNCGDAVPALPFGYAWVGNTTGIPEALVGSHGKGTTSTTYYYLWRFGWVFYLMGLVFDVLGFFAALLSPFSRLASGLSGLIIFTALFFFTLGASLMTAEFVKARDQFRSGGKSASIGRYAFGFTWGAWAAMFLASVFLFLGCGLGGRNETSTSRSVSTSKRTGFFRRQRRSTRGSFVGGESESQQRVKDEY